MNSNAFARFVEGSPKLARTQGSEEQTSIQQLPCSADIIVDEIKKSFSAAYGEIDDAAVRKITGSVDRVGDLIRSFLYAANVRSFPVSASNWRHPEAYLERQQCLGRCAWITPTTPNVAQSTPTIQMVASG